VNKTFTQKIRIEDTKRKIADDQQAPKKSKPKTSVNNESPDPRIRDLINCWCREWEAFYGQPYAVDWGADNAAFKHCLKRGLSFELLQAAIPLHIQDSDPFWEKMKSIRTFASPKHINRWT